MSIVCYSRETRKGVYHEEWCPYIGRILPRNRRKDSLKRAELEGRKPCKFCQSMQGEAWHWRKKGLDCIYHQRTNSICVKMKASFWKAIMTDDGVWRLYHMNSHGYKHFDPERPAEELANGQFHRQWDVPEQKDLKNIISYIKKHDASKEQLDDLVRSGKSMQAPTQTKQQKKLLKQARNRLKKEQVKNVYRIFQQLECERAAVS